MDDLSDIDEFDAERYDKNSEIYSQNIQTHPQAIYTSRLLNFKNLPEPVNSLDLSSFQSNSAGNLT